jgi:ligand-binding sensor domain-containing protein
VTRDDRQVYAASEGGLLMLDLFGERFEMPSTVEDGYPAFEGPTAVAYDPRARVVWLGTATGSLHTYQVDFRRWRLESTPGLGPVMALVPFEDGLDDGVYMKTATGWYRVDRVGGGVQPVPPDRLPVEAVARELRPVDRLARLEPSFAAAGATLTADRAARTWPISDFVGGDRRSVYWLGTAGNGLYRYDARFFEAAHVPFGLLTTGASALGHDEQGLWIGGDGRGPRRGPVRATWDLQRWEQYESGIEAAPGEPVEDILVTEKAVWLGSTSGLHRFDPGSGAWLHVGGSVGRLPVRRLVESEDGLWAASDRGLMKVLADGVVDEWYFGGRQVLSVLETGRVVWVGGAAGLVRADRQGGVLGITPEGPLPPPGPIVDLVQEDGDVWAATPDALWRHGDGGWEGPLREVPSNLGRIRRLRVTGGALWAVGDGGAARRMPDGSGWQYLLVERDLPAGPTYDVLVTDEHVHVSTTVGVVRLDRRRGY